MGVFEEHNFLTKYIPKYVYKLNLENEDMPLRSFISAMKDDLTFVNDEMGIVKFTIAKEDANTLYIAPMVDDIVVTIGLSNYTLAEVMDENFYIDYTDNSELFDTDYEDVIGEVNRDFGDARYRIKEFAKDWGFKEETEVKESLTEDRDSTIPLEYNDLHVEFYYDFRGREEEFDDDISYTYEVERSDIEYALADDILATDPKFVTMSDDEYFKYIKENLDTLIDLHYEELLEYFRDDAEYEARERMSEEYQPADPDEYWEPWDEE